jgi:hypothetical protein
MSDRTDRQLWLEIERLVRKAEGDQWSVDLERDGDTVRVAFSHLLTSRHTQALPLAGGEGQALEGLRRLLGRREFRVIKDRPAETPHADTLRQARMRLAAHRLDGHAVEVVADVLWSHDLLTEPEREWLVYAGPAWAEDSRPAQDSPALLWSLSCKAATADRDRVTNASPAMLRMMAARLEGAADSDVWDLVLPIGRPDVPAGYLRYHRHPGNR